MRTIVIMGLGNPGTEYARTRHNVGFRCVDHFAVTHGSRFSRTACKARLAEFHLSEVNVVLAKPRTYMNLSGHSAAGLLHTFGIRSENLVVVYDDVDLPLGRLRIRSSGGPGGHNGVRSIITQINTDRFPRVRVGIGRPDDLEDTRWSDESLISYVLSALTSEEESIVEEAVIRVGDVLECIVTDGVDAAMNRFNSVV